MTDDGDCKNDRHWVTVLFWLYKLALIIKRYSENVILLFSEDALNRSKVIVKTFIMKYSILNKCCSFKLSIPQRILKNKTNQFTQKYEAAQLFSTLIIIRNVFWAANQHIRMISEESCDTEDWSNDAENTAAHHSNQLHFKYNPKSEKVGTVWKTQIKKESSDF